MRSKAPPIHAKSARMLKHGCLCLRMLVEKLSRRLSHRWGSSWWQALKLSLTHQSTTMHRLTKYWLQDTHVLWDLKKGVTTKQFWWLWQAQSTLRYTNYKINKWLSDCRLINQGAIHLRTLKTSIQLWVSCLCLLGDSEWLQGSTSKLSLYLQ